MSEEALKKEIDDLKVKCESLQQEVSNLWDQGDLYTGYLVTIADKAGEATSKAYNDQEVIRLMDEIVDLSHTALIKGDEFI